MKTGVKEFKKAYKHVDIDQVEVGIHSYTFRSSETWLILDGLSSRYIYHIHVVA